MLTSPKNPTIQHIRKLQAQARYRRETGLFVIEGARLTGECLGAGVLPELVLYTESLVSDLPAAFESRGVETLMVSDAVMQAAGDTKTPQGILAVVPQSGMDRPAQTRFAVILDGVRDPGNVGTILRTASAAGADVVLLAPGCADAFSPKVVRSGMGAHFQLPVRTMEWAQIGSWTEGLTLYLADARGEEVYTSADFRRPVGLVIGGEAFGAGAAVEVLKPRGVRIPMPGGVESLNAAIAAGILMFEVVRQRGQ